MPTDLAFNVVDLSKFYRLYDSPLARLKESFHPLRKKYHREFHALENISFQVRRGETIGILGRNGSGKSTLLKMLTGVLTPSAGQVVAHGRVLALLELGAGFNPELTGVENVYFNGTLLGISRQEMNNKLDAILEFADIGEFVNQPVKTYSSGMYVRLAFAVIANMDADVLIIDEALSVGDAFFVQKCMRFLREFIKDGTLIFVSHDTGAVTGLCSRAIWLEDGLMKMDGHPKEVAEAYLADFYQDKQGDSLSRGTEKKVFSAAVDEKDMRLDFLNTTKHRNDIKLFKFRPNDKSFGRGGAEIVDVQILNEAEQVLSWCVGGENIHLRIVSIANQDLHNPIIGFVVKDKLGQVIFSDNTYLTYALNPKSIEDKRSFEAWFSFRMPVMPSGDYSISIAVADGSQGEHVQHHWINDALIFKIESSSVCHGLIGVPMQRIEIRS